MPVGARRRSSRKKGWPARQHNSSLLVSARQLQALVRRQLHALSDERSRRYSLRVFDRVANSDGIIKTVVLLFSAPTSAIICMRRNSSAAGLPAIFVEAAASSSDASNSASALIIRARFVSDDTR